MLFLPYWGSPSPKSHLLTPLYCDIHACMLWGSRVVKAASRDAADSVQAPRRTAASRTAPQHSLHSVRSALAGGAAAGAPCSAAATRHADLTAASADPRPPSPPSCAGERCPDCCCRRCSGWIWVTVGIKRKPPTAAAAAVGGSAVDPATSLGTGKRQSPRYGVLRTRR